METGPSSYDSAALGSANGQHVPRRGSLRSRGSAGLADPWTSALCDAELRTRGLEMAGRDRIPGPELGLSPPTSLGTP